MKFNLGLQGGRTMKSPAQRVSVSVSSAMRKLAITAIRIAACLFLATGLYAQAVAVAQIEGTVSDPTAKYIVGASVTLTDTDTKRLTLR